MTSDVSFDIYSGLKNTSNDDCEQGDTSGVGRKGRSSNTILSKKSYTYVCVHLSHVLDAYIYVCVHLLHVRGRKIRFARRSISKQQQTINKVDSIY